MKCLRFAIFSLGGIAIGVLSAQAQQIPDLTVGNYKVQFHAFASQGYAYTNDNNWLTMNTSDGSAAMTDFGVNATVQLNDKLRIGAQFYDRNIGHLGQWSPEFDWGFADYRVKDWLGFRGGKVKTVLGLYNDTQDLDFLHTFAFLPQSVYPTDLRDSTIAHTGGDVYGTISAKKAGSFAYTLYAGHREDSPYGGYPYYLKDVGIDFSSYGGLQYGTDLRWNTPVAGLTVGASGMKENITGTGTSTIFGPPTPYAEHSKNDTTDQFYGEYVHGNLRLDTEYRRYLRDQDIFNNAGDIYTDTRGWYGAAAYRISKRFELGGYYSRFTSAYTTNIFGSTGASLDTSIPGNHIFDKVLCVRFDATSFWNVKLEGHFMNGNDSTGEYPDGFKPNTIAFVARTGVNF